MNTTFADISCGKSQKTGDFIEFSQVGSSLDIHIFSNEGDSHGSYVELKTNRYALKELYKGSLPNKIILNISGIVELYSPLGITQFSLSEDCLIND